MYAHLMARTMRIDVEGLEHFERALTTGRPILFALWHQQMHPFLAFVSKYTDARNFVVIVAGDARGDILAQMGHTIGATVMTKVAMDGDPRAAARGVLRVIKTLQGGGKYSVLAPDGPDGPAFESKRGATFVALRTGALIIPFGGFSRHAHQMSRWDRYLVPYPFGDMSLVLGAPLDAGRGTLEPDLHAQLDNALHRARRRAMTLSGASQG